MYLFNQDDERIFNNMNLANTKNIYVQFGGHGRYKLTEEEKERFFEIHSNIEIYDEYKNDEVWIGSDSASFVVEQTNGRRIEIDPIPPHILINGERYSIELESKTALKEFQEFISELKDENF